jgi:FtsH-binding integral membrane protein
MIRIIQRVVLVTYGLAVSFASLWAWWVHLTTLHSQEEHLMPGFVLFFLGAPLSLFISRAIPIGPPFVGLILLTLCAVAQLAFLWWLQRPPRVERQKD